jgi:hypothetical protein
MTAPTPIPPAHVSRGRGCLSALGLLGCFVVVVLVILLAAIGAVSLVHQ